MGSFHVGAPSWFHIGCGGGLLADDATGWLSAQQRPACRRYLRAVACGDMMRLLAVATALVAVTPAGFAPAAPAVAPGRVLSSVSCARVRSCWAVGDRTASGVTRALIEHWNGRRWSFTASPGVAGSADTFLSGVSCPGRLNCWAVGGAALGATRQEPIAEHWNGRKWSLSVLPEPAGLAADRLAGIWCPGATRCWAVGSAAHRAGAALRPLAEHWTGKKWSVVPARVSGGFTDLVAVFCRHDTNCWAVGAKGVGGGAPGGLAEHWNGHRWSVAATPSAAATLFGIWCGLAPDCFATGYSSFPTVIAERWNGRTWSLTPTSPRPFEIVGSLQAVSCATSTTCFAVGVQGEANPQTLIERWQRSRWVKVKSPNPAGATAPALRAVSCLSPKACWAVGLRAKLNTPGPASTLAEHWNGRRWSIVPTP